MEKGHKQELDAFSIYFCWSGVILHIVYHVSKLHEKTISQKKSRIWHWYVVGGSCSSIIILTNFILKIKIKTAPWWHLFMEWACMRNLYIFKKPWGLLHTHFTDTRYPVHQVSQIEYFNIDFWSWTKWYLRIFFFFFSDASFGPHKILFLYAKWSL